MKRAGCRLYRSIHLSPLLLILFSSLALVGVARAQREPQVRVEMSADKTELTIRDNVTLRIFVQAQGAGQPDIEIPELEGFQVVQHASQHPMQFSFGFGNSQPVMTSTVQHTFVLVPMGPGTFKIPPVKVSLGQRVFQSKALVLTVTGTSDQAQQKATGAPQGRDPNAQQPSPAAGEQAPAAQASGDVSVYDNDAFLRTVVDKLEPYEGEQVTATIYLYTRHNLQQVPAVQHEASTDGFWVQDLLSPTRSLEPSRQVVNGRGFWVYTLRRFAAFPLRPGELTIGSMSLTITRERVFDLFDPSRGGPAELQRKSVPVLLHVKELPAENRPSGPIAVGDFELKTALDRAQVATGDAVTWTATLQGRGNLRAIKLPDPRVKGLQILQPEVRDLTESPNDRVQSTRTFAWLVVPQSAGSYELPALSLDTFDPATSTYKRISSERLTLTAAGAADAAGSAKPSPGADEQPIKTEAEDEAWPPLRTHSELRRASTPLASRAYFPYLLLVWPLLWAGISFGPGLVSRLRARGSGTPEQAALRNARKRLQQAERALEARDPRSFHADIAAALNSTLEVRLGENVTGLTQSALRRELDARGMPEKLSRSVCEVLAHCDFARFSSAQVSEADMRQLLARSEQLWSDIAAFTPRPSEGA